MINYRGHDPEIRRACQYMNYTLGLDMGVASLGWAVVSEEDEFVDTGVRVFPAAVEAFNSPKGEASEPGSPRISGNAEQDQTKGRAKEGHFQGTRHPGLETNRHPDALDDWFALDVYELRHRAIHEKISLPRAWSHHLPPESTQGIPLPS